MLQFEKKNTKDLKETNEVTWVKSQSCDRINVIANATSTYSMVLFNVTTKWRLHERLPAPPAWRRGCQLGVGQTEAGVICRSGHLRICPNGQSQTNEGQRCPLSPAPAFTTTSIFMSLLPSFRFKNIKRAHAANAASLRC